MRIGDLAESNSAGRGVPGWNISHGSTQYPETLHGFLLRGASQLDDQAVVLECGEPATEIRPVSYRQLATLVDRYTDQLRQLGLGVGDRVILESETSACAIALLLACSSLGVAFVPVSAEIPARRLLTVIEAAEPALVAWPEARKDIQIPDGIGIVTFGPDSWVVDRLPEITSGRARPPVSTDVAYIAFTSGTTGRPKGVIMTHRAIVAFYRAMLSESMVATPGRVASTSPFHFDFALLDIGLAFGSGAGLVAVPRRLIWQPQKFVRFLAASEATQVNGVPSVWPPILRHAARELSALSHIRGILYSGEPFPMPVLRDLRRALPQARIVNCFGSTESVACSFVDVPKELGEDITELPIGPPRCGAAMVLVDGQGKQISTPGQVGEIYLHTPALFNGYWRDLEATRQALVPDPFDERTGQMVYRSGDLGRLGDDGRIYFCGRSDHQVKIRGNRVELGDVESAIQAIPGIDGVAVLALPAGAGSVGLFAFVATTQADRADILSHCEATLPSYMVPLEIHLRPELPWTLNGKIDRRALAESVAMAR